VASDIKLIWDNDTQEADIDFGDEDLVRENGLESAVIMSLFTDRRAKEDDTLDDKNDKRGWWGDRLDVDANDDKIGSRIWLLERSKTTNQTIVKLKEYILEALDWMVEDGVAMKVDAEVERQGDPGNDRLAFSVTIYKIDGNNETYKFDDLWNNQMGIG